MSRTIDAYPEYHAGTLPHDRAAAMATGRWDRARLWIADLCHYVGDLHQPLHCTLNYDGQLTGNNGIHSRYETRVVVAS